MSLRLLGWAPAVFLALAACGDVDNDRLEAESHGLNCAASSFTAFDPANHAIAGSHVGVQAVIAAEAAEAIEDPAKAEEVFGQIEQAYQHTQGLRAAVRALAGEDATDLVGERIDLGISTAIAKGKGARTKAEVAIAAAYIDSSLTRFFYLTAKGELAEGAREAYDVAYGYMGTGAENRASEARSIAAVAAQRDADNGTSLAESLFEELLTGACLLDRKLLREDADSLDPAAYAPYASEIDELGDTMTQALALSVSQAAVAMQSLDIDAASVRVQEAVVFFAAIEPAMVAQGGQAKDDAAKIEAMLAKAANAVEIGGDPTRALDVPFVVASIEAAFGVAPR